MRNFNSKSFLIILIAVLSINLIFSQISSHKATDGPIIWISDGTSLDSWSQMNGDAIFDNSNQYTDNIEAFNGKYSAENQSSQSGWWDPSLIDPARWAGIFSNQTEGLNSDEWEFTTKVDLNNTQQTSGSYTFKGYVRIYIFNSNKEPMLQLNIRDAAGSTGLTYTTIEFVYFDSDGFQYRGSTDDYDPEINIEDGLLGIKHNSTGCYWRTPTTWLNPTTGDWIYWGSTSEVLTRGKPTFIGINVIRQWRRPTKWSFDDVTLNSKNNDNSSVNYWISDGTSLDSWSQMKGDPIFDNLSLYSENIEVNSGEYTAENRSNQSGWWDPSLVDPYKYAGIFSNQSNGLNLEEWEFTTKINLNNTQQTSGSYTFQGYVRIFIFNSKKEVMLQLDIRDQGGSTGLTNTAVETIYYDSEGYAHVNSTDDFDPTINIDYEVLGIRRNSTGIYWRAPATWLNPTTGDWIYWGSPSELFAFGIPTFIGIDVLRHWRRPTEWAFDDIIFSYKSSMNTTESSTTTTTTTTTTTRTSIEQPVITNGFSWITIIIISPILLFASRKRRKK